MKLLLGFTTDNQSLYHRPSAQLIDLTESTSDEEEIANTPVKKPRLDNSATNAQMNKVNKGPKKNHEQSFASSNLQNGNSSTSSAESMHEKSNSKIKLSPSFKKIINTSPIVKLKKIPNSDKQPNIRRYPIRDRRKPVNLALDGTSSRASSSTSSKDKQEKRDKKRPIRLEDMYDWSDCMVALEHDKKYNFFPEPGPSHINFYENVNLPGYYAPQSLNDSIESDSQSKDDYNEYDIHCHSLYEASILQHSPISQRNHSPDPFFNISDLDEEPSFQISTPLLRSIKANFQTSANKYRTTHEYVATPVTITPAVGPVLKDLINYDLPQVVSKVPFYSNSDDVANIKEIGNHILQIPNLTECENFESSLISTGLNAWRRNIYTNIASMDNKETLQNKSLYEIREFFAVQKRIIIKPGKVPPTVNQAVLWLRNKREENNKKMVDVDNDSPIKVRREKAKIILENGADEDGACDVSLSCSPLVALSNNKQSKLVNKHLAKVSRPTVKAKKSLNNTFDDLKKSTIVRESPSMFSDSESPPLAFSNDPNDVPDSDEEIPSSQVISFKHLRPKKENHMNGHTDTSTSNHMSDTSSLVNSVS